MLLHLRVYPTFESLVLHLLSFVFFCPFRLSIGKMVPQLLCHAFGTNCFLPGGFSTTLTKWFVIHRNYICPAICQRSDADANTRGVFHNESTQSIANDTCISRTQQWHLTTHSYIFFPCQKERSSRPLPASLHFFRVVLCTLHWVRSETYLRLCPVSLEVVVQLRKEQYQRSTSNLHLLNGNHH